MLPTRMNLPLTYTNAELEALRGSNTLLRMIKRQSEMVKKLHKNLLNTTAFSGVFDGLPLEDVMWAYSVAQSRGFNIYVEGRDDNDTEFALIPLVDMMNHDSASASDIRMSVEGSDVVVTSNGGYALGADFTGRYLKENRTAASWLASYGFINTKSLYQGLRVDYPAIFRAAQFDRGHSERLLKALQGIKCEATGWNGKPFGLTVDGFSPGYLLCMRMALLSVEDYTAIASKPKSIHMDNAFSIANEQKMIGTVNSLLRQLLSGYATTLSQDTEALKELPDGNMKNIITLRQREKALYFYGLRILEKMASEANLDRTEL